MRRFFLIFLAGLNGVAGLGLGGHFGQLAALSSRKHRPPNQTQQNAEGSQGFKHNPSHDAMHFLVFTALSVGAVFFADDRLAGGLFDQAASAA